MSRLKLVPESPLSKRELYELEVKALLEKKWLKGRLEAFNPLLNAEGRERIKRTEALLQKYANQLEGIPIADLGCGTGVLASHLSKLGAKVTAVDVLSEVQAELSDGILFRKACLPFSKLAEESFEGVLLTDVIADLPLHMHRLLISEAAALLRKGGWFVCSTPLDLHSLDALPQFLNLIETEFEHLALIKSFHRGYFYLRRFLQGPHRCFQAFKESEYRKEQLEKREGLMKLWFRLNSSRPLAWIWSVFSGLSFQCSKRFIQSDKLLFLLERASETLWGEGALTHVIVFARKKGMLL